jgi:hypothetical protein
VDDANSAAATFYASLGFWPTGESRPVNPDSPHLERSMEMPLVAG